MNELLPHALSKPDKVEIHELLDNVPTKNLQDIDKLTGIVMRHYKGTVNPNEIKAIVATYRTSRLPSQKLWDTLQD